MGRSGTGLGMAVVWGTEQKAVIASGYSESRQVKAAQNMGAGTYVKKPYSFEKIGLAVKGELSK